MAIGPTKCPTCGEIAIDFREVDVEALILAMRVGIVERQGPMGNLARATYCAAEDAIRAYFAAHPPRAPTCCGW